VDVNKPFYGAFPAAAARAYNELPPTIRGPIYKISYDNLTIILRQCESYDRHDGIAYNLQNIVRRAQGFS